MRRGLALDLRVGNGCSGPITSPDIHTFRRKGRPPEGDNDSVLSDPSAALYLVNRDVSDWCNNTWICQASERSSATIAWKRTSELARWAPSIWRDMRLCRPVALKVLATDLSDGTLGRVRDEALTLSRLSHPNIAAVFDFGFEGSFDFLVMEYVPTYPACNSTIIRSNA